MVMLSAIHQQYEGRVRKVNGKAVIGQGWEDLAYSEYVLQKPLWNMYYKTSVITATILFNV